MKISVRTTVLTILLLAIFLTLPTLSLAAAYTLTVNTNGSGTVTRNPTNSVYPQGAVVTLTAIPASGWMFASTPALNALEHPVYDVWVITCKTDEPAPVAAAPPQPGQDSGSAAS